jgi:thiamine biosynthesis lipoprotein
MMTDFDPESELMQLCKKPVGQPARVSDELFDIIEKSQRVAELSGGAFDITVGPVVRLWRRARRTEELPDEELLAKARATVGWKNLTLNSRNKTVTLGVPNMQLDLGGIAKGYAADQAIAVLKSNGVSRALVAASGDIAVSDPPPGKSAWRIGIGAMDSGRTNTPQTVHTLLLKNSAVSTSGDTEQFVVINGKRYSHVIDPRTGVGLQERLQVTIVGRNATDTDSFGKVVSVLGVEPGLRIVESQPGLAALVFRKKGEQVEEFKSRRFKSIPESR